MVENNTQTGSAPSKLAGATEHGRWKIFPHGEILQAAPPPPHSPVGTNLSDEYPLILPGTPNAGTSAQASEVDRTSPDRWLPDPTPRRRREPCYSVKGDRIWIQWWSDGDFNGLSTRLANVSQHGTMIAAAARLHAQETLRVELEEPDQLVRSDAPVLSLIEGLSGMHKVRLGFLPPCPDDFFIAVANGFEAWFAGNRSPT